MVSVKIVGGSLPRREVTDCCHASSAPRASSRAAEILAGRRTVARGYILTRVHSVPIPARQHGFIHDLPSS